MDNNEVSEAKILDDLKKDPNFIKYLELLKKDSIWKIQKNLRAELPHTNFIAWLLDPKETHGLGFEPISLFLRSIFWICNGNDRKDNRVKANDEISIDIKSIIETINNITKEDEDTRRNYIKDVNVYTDKSGNVNTRGLLRKYRASAYGDKSDLDDATIEKYTDQNKLAKLDLFIEVTYQLPNEEENTLNIIIENKTKSKETKTDVEQITGTGVEKRSIGQTIKYEVWADKELENKNIKGDIIFIHWTPNSDYQLTIIGNNDDLEFKCESKKYIKYNYQTFESKVIERIGVLKSNDSLKTHYILEDYKNCLSFNINADPYILAHPLVEYDLAYELLKEYKDLFEEIYNSQSDVFGEFRDDEYYNGFLLSFAETCLSSYRPAMVDSVNEIKDNLINYYNGSDKGKVKYSLTIGDKQFDSISRIEAVREIIKHTVSETDDVIFIKNYIGIVVDGVVHCEAVFSDGIGKIKTRDDKNIVYYSKHKPISCLYNGSTDFYENGIIADIDKDLMENVAEKCKSAFECNDQKLLLNNIFIKGTFRNDAFDELCKSANTLLKEAGKTQIKCTIYSKKEEQ